jgi:hypothetical protein
LAVVVLWGKTIRRREHELRPALLRSGDVDEVSLEGRVNDAPSQLAVRVIHPGQLRFTLIHKREAKRP